MNVLSKLPLPLLYLLSNVAYYLVYYVLRYRRSTVSNNLAKALPQKSEQERRQIAKRFYRNLVDVFFEVVHAKEIDPADMTRRVQFENYELVDSYLQSGQSLMVITAHYANWEWLLISLSLRIEQPTSVVYKPLHNKKSDDFMYSVRSRFGVDPIDLKDFAKEVVKRKKQQQVYTLLADQRPASSSKSHVTEYLHQPTAFFTGPEKIAQFTKVPIVFVQMRRLSRGQYSVKFTTLAEPPYKKVRGENPITEKYVREVERIIYAEPENFLWSNKRWKKPVVLD